MILHNSSVDTIIILGEIKEKSRHILTWNEFIKLEPASQTEEYCGATEKLFFLAKTGGTTGNPKSVMLSDEGFNNVVHQLLTSPLKYNRGDKWLRMWPLFSATAAVCSCHMPLCAGMEVIIYPLQYVEDIDRIIIETRPNHIMLTPAILDVLVKSPLLKGMDLSYIKTSGCGGVGITNALEQQALQFFEQHNIAAFLGVGYGMTENSSSAASRIDLDTSKLGGVGIPWSNTTIGIFDPISHRELPYNTLGEICIQSYNLMLGYYKNKELTQKVLIHHENGDIWLHSGDLGYMDEDGILYVVDRIKRVITIFPQDKIFPIDIDNLIQTIEGVDLVVTVAQPDLTHVGFFVPVCFISLEDGYASNDVLNRIAIVCKDKLPEYSVPRHLYICSKIPLTNIGKPDIKSLEERAVKYLEEENTEKG